MPLIQLMEYAQHNSIKGVPFYDGSTDVFNLLFTSEFHILIYTILCLTPHRFCVSWALCNMIDLDMSFIIDND